VSCALYSAETASDSPGRVVSEVSIKSKSAKERSVRQPACSGSLAECVRGLVQKLARVLSSAKPHPGRSRPEGLWTWPSRARQRAVRPNGVPTVTFIIHGGCGRLVTCTWNFLCRSRCEILLRQAAKHPASASGQKTSTSRTFRASLKPPEKSPTHHTHPIKPFSFGGGVVSLTSSFHFNQSLREGEAPLLCFCFLID